MFPHRLAVLTALIGAALLVAPAYAQTATGTGAVASGANSTATGKNAQATGDNSTADGANANAAGANCTVVGAGAQGTRGDNCTAVGANADVGPNGTAVGANSVARDNGSTVVGTSGFASRAAPTLDTRRPQAEVWPSATAPTVATSTATTVNRASFLTSMGLPSAPMRPLAITASRATATHRMTLHRREPGCRGDFTRPPVNEAPRSSVACNDLD